MHTDDEIKALFQEAQAIYPEIDLEAAILKKVQASAKRKKAWLWYQRLGRMSLLGFSIFSGLFFILDHATLGTEDLNGLTSAIFVIFCLLLIQLELRKKIKFVE